MFPTNLYILEHKLGLLFMYTNVLATAYHFYLSNVKWSNLFIFSYKGLTWDSQPASQPIWVCVASSALFLCSEKNRATCHWEKTMYIPISQYYSYLPKVSLTVYDTG